MERGCEPTPSVMASGIGESMCAASYSLFSVLSRITAQPGGLDDVHVEARAGEEAHRLRHDDGGAAGDGDEAHLEVRLLDLPLPCAKASRAAASGKNCATAASAVFAPTALRKRRRAASRGIKARITAASTVRLQSGVHVVRCGAGGEIRGMLGLARVPAAAAPGRKPESGSNGSLNMDMCALSSMSR